MAEQPQFYSDLKRADSAGREPHYYSSLHGGGVSNQPSHYMARTQTYDNAAYNSASSSGRGTRYRVGHEPENDDYFTLKLNKTCCIVVSIICIFILLAAGLGLGLYFGVFAKSESKSTPEPSSAGTTARGTVSRLPQSTTTGAPATGPQVTTTTPAPEPTTSPAPEPTEVFYDVALTLDQDFSPDLDDPTSQTYIDLKNDIENLMHGIMGNSDVNESYVSTTVTGFREGSIIADMLAFFLQSKVIAVEINEVVVLAAVKKGLKTDTASTQRLKILEDKTDVALSSATGSKDLGEICVGVKDCLDNYTVCSGWPIPVCRCSVDYFDSNGPVKIGGACQRKIEINSHGCKEASQCAGPETLCNNSVCICPATHGYHEGQCFKKKFYGEYCNNTGECAEMLMCAENTCLCPSTSFADGALCKTIPAGCDDQATFQSAAVDCGVTLSTFTQDIQGYSCRTLNKKITCIRDALNHDRPIVYHCSGTDIRDRLLEKITDKENSASFNITTCAEFTVAVEYFGKSCANRTLLAEAEVDFKNTILSVLFAKLDYEYIKARCKYDNFLFEISVWSGEEENILRDMLNDVLYTHKIFENDRPFIRVNRNHLDTNYCKDISTLKRLGVECIRDIRFWGSSWEICRIHSLTSCIREKILQRANLSCYYIDLEDILFNDNTVKEELIIEVTLKLTGSGNKMNIYQEQWLRMISRYSLLKCPEGKPETYPCDDYTKWLEIYDVCRNRTLTSPFNINGGQTNYGLTANNCRGWHNLVSCIWDEYRKLEVQCIDLEERIYSKLRKEIDANRELPEKFQDFCSSYEPVCTARFILGAKEQKCDWNTGGGSSRVSCTSEADTVKVLHFVTCIRLYALSRHQEECSTSRIKEIINNGLNKLYIIDAEADIDDCIDDNSIATILPTRESVCTSGVPIALYQGHCEMFSHASANQTTIKTNARACPTTARDLATAGRVSLTCRLYLAEMGCVQKTLSDMYFDCSMEQLINAFVPSTSPLYIRNYRQRCLDIFNTEDFQICDSSLVISREAYICSNYLFYSVYTIEDNKERYCKLYQEALGCTDTVARNKNASCTVSRLSIFMTEAAALQKYSQRAREECDSLPDTPKYDTCPVVMPDGDICTDIERMTNLVVGVCVSILKQDKNRSFPDELAFNLHVCSQLQPLVYCGTNITRCTPDQVISALFKKADLVTAFVPGIDISVCNDSCYQTYDAVNKCIHPYSYVYGLDNCRKYNYMWQCLDAQLRRNDGSNCGPSILKAVLAMSVAGSMNDTCPEPNENPLEVCENAMDVAALVAPNCWHYRSSNDQVNCSDADKEKSCYEKVITTFDDSCTNLEQLLNRVMVIRLSSFDSLNNVGLCVGEKFRTDGFCPYYENNYCSLQYRDPEACVLDMDCSGDLKCCYRSCNSTCRISLADPARWYGELILKNETYVSGMGVKSSAEYDSFLKRYSAFISTVLGQFYRYEIRELSSGIRISFYIWSVSYPRPIITRILDQYSPGLNLIIEIGNLHRDEEERYGECPSSDSTGDDCTGEPCNFDVDCSISTAKCCNRNCGQGNSKRICFDLGPPPSLGFDCLDILVRGLGNDDGIYQIQLKGTNETISVYCDMTTDGGGWTVFQRRFNGSVDFYRNFSEYENGFGSLEGEFWLGLRYIYTLTNGLKSYLRFDMTNSTNDNIYELINGFRLALPPKYKLYIDGYTISGEGWSDDFEQNHGLGYYNGHPFSTYDADRSGYNCPVYSHGAFWYSACSDVNPNGEYVTPGTIREEGRYGGIIYFHWMGFKSLKSTQMMIRRQE